ncbi:hypothetical protein OH807_00625 [Kitasatospora sp. NBC_01560]
MELDLAVLQQLPEPRPPVGARDAAHFCDETLTDYCKFTCFVTR